MTGALVVLVVVVAFVVVVDAFVVVVVAFVVVVVVRAVVVAVVAFVVVTVVVVTGAFVVVVEDTVVLVVTAKRLSATAEELEMSSVVEQSHATSESAQIPVPESQKLPSPTRLWQSWFEVTEQGSGSARAGIERLINAILNILPTIFSKNGNRE